MGPSFISLGVHPPRTLQVWKAGTLSRRGSISDGVILSREKNLKIKEEKNLKTKEILIYPMSPYLLASSRGHWDKLILVLQSSKEACRYANDDLPPVCGSWLPGPGSESSYSSFYS